MTQVWLLYKAGPFIDAKARSILFLRFSRRCGPFNITAEEFDPCNFSIVREGSGPLGLKPTDNRVTRTGHKAGPHIVWSPSGVVSCIQVSFVITDEAHTV